MSEANSYQIGGVHYQTPYQHWDFVPSAGLCYFTGCSTKYVTRWRKKSGLEDLKKSLHYLNKLQEVGPLTREIDFPAVTREVVRFNNDNKLSDLERAFIATLVTWRTHDDLNGARQLLFLLMDEAEALEGVEKSSAVPLTEENHYADREDPMGR